MPCTPPKSSLQLHRINTTNTHNNTINANVMCQKQQHLKFHGSTPFPRPPTQEELVPDAVARRHAYSVGPNQCYSTVFQSIAAPISTVWSVVRRFDQPQVYKHFVKSCNVIIGHGEVGTLREVHIVSGLPAATSTERLEILDDEHHVLSFSVVGGDHRLSNYRSVTTLHSPPGRSGTIVVESYVVDVPLGNTKEDTCGFVNTIVKCNLQSLAQIAQGLVSAGVCRA